MAAIDSQAASPRNEWRKQTPGHAGWARTAYAGDPHKYYMVSVDTHGIEPNDYLEKRIEKKYLHRIPRMKIDEDGAQWTICEGMKPVLVKPGRNYEKHLPALESFEDIDMFQPYSKRFEAEDLRRNHAGTDITQRLADADADGIDAEIIFPNKGLLAFGTRLTRFFRALCSGPGTAGRWRPLAITGSASCPWP